MKKLTSFTELLRKTGQCVTGCITKTGVRRVVYQDTQSKEVVIETKENIYDLLNAIEFREKEFGKHWRVSVKKKGQPPSPSNNWLETWLMQNPKNRYFTLAHVGNNLVQCSLIQKVGKEKVVYASSIGFDVMEALKNTKHAYRHIHQIAAA